VSFGEIRVEALGLPEHFHAILRTDAGGGVDAAATAIRDLAAELVENPWRRFRPWSRSPALYEYLWLTCHTVTEPGGAWIPTHVEVLAEDGRVVELRIAPPRRGGFLWRRTIVRVESLKFELRRGPDAEMFPFRYEWWSLADGGEIRGWTWSLDGEFYAGVITHRADRFTLEFKGPEGTIHVQDYPTLADAVSAMLDRLPGWRDLPGTRLPDLRLPLSSIASRWPGPRSRPVSGRRHKLSRSGSGVGLRTGQRDRQAELYLLLGQREMARRARAGALVLERRLLL
jgi:hypothetical protein